MSRKALVLLPLIAIACTAIRVANAQIPPKTPDAFLKWSMDRYAKMKTFQAECTWSARYGSPNTHITKRRIWIASPNLFRITSITQNSNYIQMSVCDGEELVERTIDSVEREQRYEAPSTIAQAQSMLMQHNMFCGSLLYQFFGGSKRVTALVDTSKSPVKFSTPITLDGQPCKVVKFWARGMKYGNVEIAIGAKDGLVRRIRYDSKGLLKIMASQEGQYLLRNSMRESLKSPEMLARIKEMGQTPEQFFASILKTSTPTTITAIWTTERYTAIKVGQTLSPDTFKVSAAETE